MLLSRDPPVADLLTLAPGVALARARAHEAAGPSRHLFALLAGAALTGPILWLRPAWVTERLNGDGMRAFLDPGRLILGTAKGAADILWAAEEALRGGQAPLVVAELAAPPGLTAVRRLHLAAESGGAPVMLLLTPEQGGAPGIETRWHLAPLPGWAKGDRIHPGPPRWRLTRLRARAAPEQSWEMCLDAESTLNSATPRSRRSTAPASGR